MVPLTKRLDVMGLFYHSWLGMTVAWKLGQPKHIPLSSVAEELAAWAIINQAKAFTEEDKDGKQ